MRRAAPVDRPVALSIAGSDSGGGAGIQADLQTMAAHGAFGTSVVTAVTAQNTEGVESSHVLPEAQVKAQYDAVVDDFEIGAVKTGMLATAPIVDAVADRLADGSAPVVVDPVMVATSGDRLLDADAEAAYERLLSEATLVTPNVDEAAVLTDVTVDDEASAREAGAALLELGADAALVKGGHVLGERVRDVLVTDDGATVFEHPRIDTDATHGSGCTLSAAIAARLASGEPLVDAVEAGTAFMERAVRYHYDVGHGPGAVNPLVDLDDRAARETTAEAVQGIVDRLVEADAGRLVPEVGMNVVGATPSAEAVDDVAAVEGRITRTMSGIAPNRGIRLGASSHVARFLLSAREFDPDVRFGVNCRFDDGIEAAVDALGWPATEYDRTEEPDDVKEQEGSTMGWGTRQAFERADGTPVAILDRGDVGKEPICKLLAPDAETLIERALTLLEEAEKQDS